MATGSPSASPADGEAVNSPAAIWNGALVAFQGSTARFRTTWQPPRHTRGSPEPLVNSQRASTVVVSVPSGVVRTTGASYGCESQKLPNTGDPSTNPSGVHRSTK